MFRWDPSIRRSQAIPWVRTSIKLTPRKARRAASFETALRRLLVGRLLDDAQPLHAGLRHARRLAGIIALSTYLPSADTLPDEAATANRDVPIFMAHGHGDTVIPYAMGQRSSELLKAQGYPLAWHPYFAEHTVCMEELRDIETWLRRIMVQAS